MLARYSIWIAVVLLALASATVSAGSKTVYGEGVKSPDSQKVKIGELLTNPDEYVGKMVRVQGKITDVCPRRGCWIDIAARSADDVIRVKVTDGEIVFPLEAKGHKVVAEGVLMRIEMTHEQAVSYYEHLAEERNEPFDPSTVTGPMTRYQIQGTGAVVR